MIRYALRCENDHGFESWFKSAEAFDTVKAAGMVSCPDCGSTKVEKALMAPRVRASRDAEAASEPNEKPSLKAPQSERERVLAELRRKVEENSEYVGMNFAKEARKMHEGESPERAIYGEAKLDEAKSLIEDGVPVAPLPFLPQRKAN
ncbi:MAG: DUF1178 family protein [Rhodobacteraceae bacterium]|nr:DUF1178 family protein [Paracoccaceae bacterium]